MFKATNAYISEGLGLEERKAQISSGRMQVFVDGVHEGLPKDKAKTVASHSQVSLKLEFSHSIYELKQEYTGQLVTKFSHLFITDNFNRTTCN